MEDDNGGPCNATNEAPEEIGHVGDIRWSEPGYTTTAEDEEI